MTGYDVGYGNCNVQCLHEAVETALGWAKEPCPSQQPVTLPLSYVAHGERCRGALIGGAAALAGVGLACYLGKKFFS